MNHIVIYGPGCAKCTALADATKQAMQELHLEVPLEKVTDAMQFAVAGVLVTPALAVNGRVLVSGGVPSKDEIRKILQDTFQENSHRQKSCCSGVQEAAPAPNSTSKPKDDSCCGGGGCCEGTTAKDGTRWKKVVVWVVVLLILFTAVKIINHQKNDGNKEPATKAIPIKSGVEAVKTAVTVRHIPQIQHDRMVLPVA